MVLAQETLSYQKMDFISTARQAQSRDMLTGWVVYQARDGQHTWMELRILNVLFTVDVGGEGKLSIVMETLHMIILFLHVIGKFYTSG